MAQHVLLTKDENEEKSVPELNEPGKFYFFKFFILEIKKVVRRLARKQTNDGNLVWFSRKGKRGEKNQIYEKK